MSPELIPTPTGTDHKGRGPNSKQVGIDNLFKIPPKEKIISNQLILFAADSPASHSLVPGNEKAKKMIVRSGLKCLELYKKSGPLGLLAKMLLASSEWNSTIVFLTWKEKVTPSKRLLFQLAPLVRRTEG